MKELHLNDEVGFSYDYNQGCKVLVLVTDYWEGSYEGGGEAIALFENGRVGVFNLGHCSCYGPFDNGECESFESLQDFKDRISCVGSHLHDEFLKLCQ